jgi:hypothetical protein
MSDEWYFSKLAPAEAQRRISIAEDDLLFKTVKLTATHQNTDYANLNSVSFKAPSVLVLLQAV